VYGRKRSREEWTVLLTCSCFQNEHYDITRQTGYNIDLCRRKVEAAMVGISWDCSFSCWLKNYTESRSSSYLARRRAAQEVKDFQSLTIQLKHLVRLFGTQRTVHILPVSVGGATFITHTKTKAIVVSTYCTSSEDGLHEDRSVARRTTLVFSVLLNIYMVRSKQSSVPVPPSYVASFLIVSIIVVCLKKVSSIFLPFL
jgi:hypothetical protein